MYSDRISSFGDSIFSVMSKMAKDNGAINLSQGFPDFDGPNFIKEKAKEAIDAGRNQYAISSGSQVLRESISSYYKRFYGAQFCPNTEVTVTTGASEALYCTIMATVNPGDEVIVFEPIFDIYLTSIQMAGGVIKPVTLKAENNFSYDEKELEAAFSEKTKLIILNTPHNPTGKVFNKSELDFIFNLVEKHDCFLISDEVYEFLTFDNAEHISASTYSHLKNKVFTISSGGKTFGLTGWKVGWCVSSKENSRAMRSVHQNITFSSTTPMQDAIAHGLDKLESYLPGFRKSYREKRDLFYKGITDLGFNFPKPLGTYFMMVPIPLDMEMNDIEYCEYLIKEKKVATIPPSSFYLESNEGTKFVRFCFAKENQTLEAALKNLESL